jgi:hypothetical protein
MIKVRIYNCPDKEQREIFRSCINLFIKELLPKKKNLKISLLLKKSLLKTKGELGSCYAVDNPVNRRYSEFAVRVDNTVSFYEQIHTLAHEFAHVKQYATGQLSYNSRFPEMTVWENKHYEEETIDYDDHPWEQEAAQIEDMLMERLKETGVWDG